VIEAVGVELAKESWRCFHCGEVFTDKELAQDHFAIEGVPPMCVDPLTKDEKSRMVVVRKLESELVKWREENEKLDQEAGCYHAYQSELGRYFGTCAGFPVKTPHQAFLVYEAVIGAKEAAEKRAEQAEAELARVNRVHAESVAAFDVLDKMATRYQAELAKLRERLDQTEMLLNEASDGFVVPVGMVTMSASLLAIHDKRMLDAEEALRQSKKNAEDAAAKAVEPWRRAVEEIASDHPYYCDTCHEWVDTACNTSGTSWHSKCKDDLFDSQVLTHIREIASALLAPKADGPKDAMEKEPVYPWCYKHNASHDVRFCGALEK
jgi:hypothetical protein